VLRKSQKIIPKTSKEPMVYKIAKEHEVKQTTQRINALF
jgi:hypothetical protein